MIAVHLPSFDTETDALDWLHDRYEVIRVVLFVGADGLVRGTALARDPDQPVRKDHPRGGQHAEIAEGPGRARPPAR